MMEGTEKIYTSVVCRGSWALGTACGKCERCNDTRPVRMTDFKPCERTVRMCIEALPHRYQRETPAHPVRYAGDCREALEALLLDPAEELVRGFIGSDYDDPHMDTDARMVRLIRRLINQGKVRP